MRRRVALSACLLPALTTAGCGSGGKVVAPAGVPADSVAPRPVHIARPFVRVGLLYVDLTGVVADAYVAIVRTDGPLPGRQRGVFWIDAPRQSESADEERPTRGGRPGRCYVAYFYADERNRSVTPQIFPLRRDRATLGYRFGGRDRATATIRVVLADDGLAGATQAELSRRVGCR